MYRKQKEKSPTLFPFVRLPTSQRQCCQRANSIQRGFYVRQLMTHIFECALQRQIQEIMNETHVHSNKAMATAK